MGLTRTQMGVRGLPPGLTLARLIVHKVTGCAVRRNHATDLHQLPGEAPRLLRGPCLVGAQHPDRGEARFGQTACVGGYVLDGALYLVGMDWPDGARATRWSPAWVEAFLDAGMPHPGSLSVQYSVARMTYTSRRGRGSAPQGRGKCELWVSLSLCWSRFAV